jgi:hypothetical protein
VESVDSVVVVPAYDYGTEPFGSALGVGYTTFSQWTDNMNMDFNMALITLDQPIGNYTGYYGFGYHNDDEFFIGGDHSFDNFSYPESDLLSSPVFDVGHRMYHQHGTFDYVTGGDVLGHYDEGYIGQSGSCSYEYDDGGRTVYSVLSHMMHGQQMLTNHCRITPEKFKVLSKTVGNTITGIDDAREASVKLKVFPNPATNVLHVVMNRSTPQPATLTLSNNLGQIVGTWQSVDGKFFVDLATLHLAPGLHFGTLYTAEDQRGFKVMIQ